MAAMAQDSPRNFAYNCDWRVMDDTGIPVTGWLGVESLFESTPQEYVHDPRDLSIPPPPSWNLQFCAPIFPARAQDPVNSDPHREGGFFPNLHPTDFAAMSGRR